MLNNPLVILSLHFVEFVWQVIIFVIDCFVFCQGLRFEVVPSWFKETLDKKQFKAPYEYAIETAKHKALEVAKRMPVVS